MSAGNQCQECGTAIPDGSPAGLCGRCLFGLGLAPESPSAAKGASPEAVAATAAAGSAKPPPAAAPKRDGSVQEKPGDTIGRYKLLQQIGEGGFGVVFMARQEEPVVRRVALKIVKLGMDSRQVVARFDAERQALALMDHPHIARILDAGATDTGRPYFVMELVKGIPITEYCDQHHLSPRDRLELFVPVCRAVQHAHQKGIIHRDLKPSNILVTLHDGVPVPKIIDFGIAKATQQDLTDQTVFTLFGQFIGTPAYMSPEQAEMSGLDIDTRSDIYSMGVLLYELLTGKTPFDSKALLAAGLEEMRRMIREEEPAKPSTRLSTLQAPDLTTAARHRRLEPPKLVRLVRGDLDWIVMKSLEKDRTRRYETASAFADDVEHFLRHEPVNARAPGAAYLLWKLVRRHRTAFAASAAVALSLLLGLGLSTWLFFREQQARQRSQAVARFLEEMLQGVGPAVARGRDTQLLQEILDKTVERLTTELKGQPEVQAELCNTIGEVYRALGRLDEAEKMHRGARAMQPRNPAHHPEIETSLNDLAYVLRDRGKLAEAEALQREVLELRRKRLGSEHPEVAVALDSLGLVLRAQGKLAEAERFHREALALERKLPGTQDLPIAITLNNLALVLRDEGKFAEAESSLREAVVLEKRARGEADPTVAITQDNLAFVLLDAGRLDEAEALEKQSLASLRRFFHEQHPAVATGMNNLALVFSAQNKLDQSEKLQREALAMRRQLLGEENPEVAVSLDNLAQVLHKQERAAEAEPLARQALDLRQRMLGPNHVAVAGSLNTLALVLADQGKLAEAEQAYTNALALQNKALGPEHPWIATTLNNLALLLLREPSRLSEAEKTARAALAMREKWLGSQHPATATSRQDLDKILALEAGAAAPTQTAESKSSR